MTTFEIYGLFDHRDGALRYIGKADCAAKRLASHMRAARRLSTPVYIWIRRLVSLGLAPKMEVLERVEDWIEAERRLIAVSRAEGHKLLNVAEGGDRPYCPDEVRKANGDLLVRRLDNDERLAKIQANKRAIANGLKAGHVSNETRAKLRLIAAKAPKIFGEWASIPDREE